MVVASKHVSQLMEDLHISNPIIGMWPCLLLLSLPFVSNHETCHCLETTSI